MVIDREIRLKNRKRGLSASEMVESLLALWAAGGERAEDLEQFRQDKALAMLLGHELRGPSAHGLDPWGRRPRAIFWCSSMPRIWRCCRKAKPTCRPSQCRCWV